MKKMDLIVDVKSESHETEEEATKRRKLARDLYISNLQKMVGLSLMEARVMCYYTDGNIEELAEEYGVTPQAIHDLRRSVRAKVISSGIPHERLLGIPESELVFVSPAY